MYDYNLSKCTAVQAARMYGLDTISDFKKNKYKCTMDQELLFHALNMRQLAADRREMT